MVRRSRETVTTWRHALSQEPQPDSLVTVVAKGRTPGPPRHPLSQARPTGVIKSFGPGRAYVNIAHDDIAGYMKADGPPRSAAHAGNDGAWQRRMQGLLSAHTSRPKAAARSSLLAAVALSLPFSLVAPSALSVCGGDDDDNNGGSGAQGQVLLVVDETSVVSLGGHD